MKIAVLGGCGFIGSHVCDQLLERGFQVLVLGRCLHNPYSNIKHIISNKDVEFKQADIRDIKALEKSIKNCDAVMNYAALINVDESNQAPRLFFDVNVLGAFNVLELARKMQIPTLYKSSSEVFGHVPYPDTANEKYPQNPRSPYAISKLCAERYNIVYHLTYDLPVAISRGFNTYGPRQSAGKFGAVIPKFITRVLDNKSPMIFGDGLQTRDYVFVKDMAQADVMILEALIDGKISGGEIFNICTMKDYAIKDIAYKIIELCEMDHLLTPDFVNARQGEVRRLVGTSKKIKQTLGWKPKTSFNEGLTQTIEFYTRLLRTIE